MDIMSNYPTTILNTSGLIGYWRLGETSGTTATDKTLNNNGTYAGSPGLGVDGALAGDTDKAVKFGSGKTLTVTHNSSLNVGDTFSIEFWFQSVGAGFSWLPYKKDGSETKGWTVFKNAGNNLCLQHTSILVSTSVTITDTSWHHVVFTKNGSSRHAYVDGVDVSVLGANETCDDVTDNLMLANQVNGSLDEIALYNVELSAATILSHYTAGITSPTLSYDAPLVQSSTQTEHVWEFRLAESSSFDDIAVLSDASDKQLQLALNRPGSLSFTLPLESSNASSVEAISTCVKAYRNDELVWSGPVWSISDSVPDNKVSVSCIGWFELLNHRNTLRQLSFDTQDAGKIAQLLYLNSCYFDTSSDAALTNATFLNTTNWTAHAGTTLTISGAHGSEMNLSQATNGLEAGAYGNISGTGFLSSKLYKIHLNFVSRYPTDVYVPTSTFTFKFGNKTNTDYTTLTAPKSNVQQFLNQVHSSTDIYWSPAVDTPCSDTYLDVSDLITTASSVYTWAQDSTWGIDAADPNEVPSTFWKHFVIQEAVPDIPVTMGTVQTSQTRTINYQSYVNVGQEIVNLSNIENGFDFSIDPATRELNIYSRIGEDNNVQFGYRWGPNNIEQLSRNIDSSKIANSLFVTGKYETANASDSASVGLYGTLTDNISLSDISDETILAAYANEEIVFRAYPTTRYEFIPIASGKVSAPQPFKDYNIGDTVYTTAFQGRIDIKKQAIRIFGISILIDGNNQEKVTQIQTLAEG